MLESVIKDLKKRDVEIGENIPMKRIGSIGIGGDARIVIAPKTLEQFVSILNYLKNIQIKHKIVGRMTNLLPCDQPYEGVLVRSAGLLGYSLENGILKVNAGESLPGLSSKLSRIGLGGLEELSGIPGTLGGAVVGNAGAFGREIADLVESVTVLDQSSGKVTVLSNSDLSFGYRHSALKGSGLILLSAKLRLYSADPGVLTERIHRFRNERSIKQPKEPSVGSVFKRCGEHAASKLIDSCGLKGRRIGGAEISSVHAGFIVNKGGATAEDFKKLAILCEAEVYKRYGIRLEREVEYL